MKETPHLEKVVDGPTNRNHFCGVFFKEQKAEIGSKFEQLRLKNVEKIRT